MLLLCYRLFSQGCGVFAGQHCSSVRQSRLDWTDNVKKSGFLPSERQWLTELMATGWVDIVRKLHPDVAGSYSWWSWRGRAFDNDAGWRIDYQLATHGLAARADAPRVERASAYALRWSDHAPVTVEYR